MIIYPRLTSSRLEQCLIHLYSFNTGQTLIKYWTGWNLPVLVDTNHKNRTEQSVERL